jgi:hypothetical protein
MCRGEVYARPEVRTLVFCRTRTVQIGDRGSRVVVEGMEVGVRMENGSERKGDDEGWAHH